MPAKPLDSNARGLFLCPDESFHHLFGRYSKKRLPRASHKPTGRFSSWGSAGELEAEDGRLDEELAAIDQRRQELVELALIP